MNYLEQWQSHGNISHYWSLIRLVQVLDPFLGDFVYVLRFHCVLVDL